MIDKIIINGRLVHKDQPLFLSTNRSFRYGDGLFESMRCYSGKIPWLSEHLARLNKGIQLLQLAPHPDLAPERIEERCQLLSEKGNARIRLSIFREGRGTYLPESNACGYLIEAQRLENAYFQFPENGLNCACFEDHFLQGSSIENLKTANRLSNVLAAIWASQNSLDDALLLHQGGSIAEASASNLFFIQQDRWVTPPLTTGCLDGVTRKKMIDIAEELGVPVAIEQVYPDQLPHFQSVWMCNSIRGLQWIRRIGSQQYQPGDLAAVIQQLNEKLKIHE